MDEYPRKTITITIGLVLIAMIGAILFGCDRSNQRSNEIKQRCIAQGSSWIPTNAGSSGGDGICLQAGTRVIDGS